MSKDNKEKETDCKGNEIEERLERIENSLGGNPGLKDRVLNLETKTEMILEELKTVNSRQWKILVMVIGVLIAITSSLFTVIL